MMVLSELVGVRRVVNDVGEDVVVEITGDVGLLGLLFVFDVVGAVFGVLAVLAFFDFLRHFEWYREVDDLTKIIIGGSVGLFERG